MAVTALLEEQYWELVKAKQKYVLRKSCKYIRKVGGKFLCSNCDIQNIFMENKSPIIIGSIAINYSHPVASRP